MSSAQYHPLPAEDIATGVTGILLFTVVLGGSTYTLLKGVKSWISKLFFGCLAVTSILEYPRYFALAIDEDYNSIGAYCCHILAGSFFFAAFTLMCYQWVDLLSISEYFKIFYGRDGLIAANIVFGCVDIASLSLCASSSSLHSYFRSAPFRALNAVEAFKNLLYSTVLCYYGFKLVRRMWNYSGGDGTVAYSKGSDEKLSRNKNSSEVVQQRLFFSVAVRIAAVLTISTICFLLRVSMLIAKIIALQNNTTITSRNFSLFGFVWFLTADFIPRALPSFAFIFLMRTKNPGGDGLDDSSGVGARNPQGDNWMSRIFRPNESDSEGIANVEMGSGIAPTRGSAIHSALHEYDAHDDGRYVDYGGHA